MRRPHAPAESTPALGRLWPHSGRADTPCGMEGDCEHAQDLPEGWLPARASRCWSRRWAHFSVSCPHRWFALGPVRGTVERMPVSERER